MKQAIAYLKMKTYKLNFKPVILAEDEEDSWKEAEDVIIEPSDMEEIECSD